MIKDTQQRILHSNKKEQTTDTSTNLDMSPIMLNFKKRANFPKVTYYIVLFLYNIFGITEF